ncbi:hypothetical protein IWW36_000629 [Coemansia brasiliensis]|uniref:Tetraspanin n=1 Tax=Coemansia brasiliensis TaxID=2650707 RepID=A0A9W8LZT9_9FUNG|nr:hypothetical protein IWW36_000629 [Coemansia brasiliensis]
MPTYTRFSEVGYDFPQAILVTLTLLNAFLGACLAVLGIYLAITSTEGFNSYMPYLCLVIIGLTVIFASGMATTGVLSVSWVHIRVTAMLSMLVILVELLLMLAVSQGPIRARSRLRTSWEAIYHANRLALQRVEHYYGCCGFHNANDLASSRNCSKLLGDNQVEGCYEYLIQTVYYLSKLSARWITVVVVIQVLSLLLGSYLIARVFEINRTWIVESATPRGDREVEPENGGTNDPALPPTTSAALAATAIQPEPPNVAEAELVVTSSSAHPTTEAPRNDDDHQNSELAN